jgi:Common central domain of tyrosinase
MGSWCKRATDCDRHSDHSWLSYPTGVLSMMPYDSSSWDTSAAGLRNRLEGWALPSAPALHNRVDVWVGGDMLPSSSPNDPVFYMNHCNVDRIWEAWLKRHGRTYQPPQSVPVFLSGHRINDLMASLVSAPMRPAPGRVLLRGNGTLPPDRSEWTAPPPDGHPLLVPAQDERVGPDRFGRFGSALEGIAPAESR